MENAEPKILSVTAFQLAESFSLKSIRSSWHERLLAVASQELFYGPPHLLLGQGPGAYTYILNYGVVIYSGHTEAEMETLNGELLPNCQNPLALPLREEFQIRTGSKDLGFSFSEIQVQDGSTDALRIVMLYVGQSVALDYYENLANVLFHGPNPFIETMKQHGRFKASRKTILKYIGESMSMRNRIIDNLYVLDAPDPAWENEYLERIDRGMKKTFDIETRSRALNDQLEVVQSNLELFSQLLQYRESNRLEWIIIGLFLFEVVMAFLK